jgi:hypothetical protein
LQLIRTRPVNPITDLNPGIAGERAGTRAKTCNGKLINR